MIQTAPIFRNKYMQELWDWSKQDDVKPELTDVERARFVFMIVATHNKEDMPSKSEKHNDNHPQQPDAEPWHEAKPSGQYRFGVDVTGAKSWQCKFAGLTIYGLKPETRQLQKYGNCETKNYNPTFSVLQI